METYREKVKLDCIILAIAAFILALFSFLNFAGEFGLIPWFNPVAGDSHWQSMWRGFNSGAAIGILALMLFGLIRNLLSLKSDTKLKKLYIKNHDERTIQVQTSAQAAGMRTALLLELVGIIVSGYFNVTVSLTILACVFVSSIITALFKLYYFKKF